MGGFSLWHWLIVLLVVVIVFGTGRLRNAGRDIGEAVKGFRKGMREGDEPGNGTPGNDAADGKPGQPPESDAGNDARH